MNFDINKDKIKIEKDGEIVECDILFTMPNPDAKKVYFGYTDHTIQDGKETMYLSAVNIEKADPENPLDCLEQITDPEELKLIGEVLNDIYEDVSEEGE